ncbi:N-acetylneuraminate synthase family protein [Cohaesibacter intestini]|uniref:N-acetylneuraminate synthase family protein n=1 Tax=Cohaesibacter intestini TaxID=2211145 RepID=UPI000DEA2BA6|nr:N-acetylneuraminate synthase family protein [Cohaesibacter intestini]
MSLKIDPFTVGEGRCFVIAEIGNNHNGSFELAIDLINQAIDAGADCVKFQMRHLDQVYRERSLKKAGEDLGSEYIVDLLQRFELSKDEHRKLKSYCDEKGVLYLCTPWDVTSLAVLEEMGVEAYKVASADLTNLPLLDALAKTGKPLILSTGMSRTGEVETTVAFLQARKAAFALLHCNSTYPAPFHDINLRWMEGLRQRHPVVGYSGHERGTAVSIAAVALGASIIERHFTADRSMEGPDHAASLEKAEFRQLVDGIRQVEEALGSGTERNLSQGEMINRENLAKSLVAAAPIAKGTEITADLIKIRSPGQGLAPHHYQALIGKTAKRDMGYEDFFYPADLALHAAEPRQYAFDRPWGVPVRYHDYAAFAKRITPDFYEFHLSYSDMDLKLEDYLEGPYDCDFVVHAPELFAESRLMDLATPDEAERQKSIAETQRVIDITRALKAYFPKTERPMIVANIGGFTMDAPLPKDAIEGYYERFAQSLEALDRDGVELIPQTMAPFPWHFGGQRYQNLFVTIEDILHYCQKLDLRMCFDISHSSLTCNHLGVDFYDFAAKIAPVSAHLHLGDASGLNGEGLQIGEGTLDFDRLGAILKQGCPDTPFIPEIWQGHKGEGEGFWIAFERLEGRL